MADSSGLNPLPAYTTSSLYLHLQSLGKPKARTHETHRDVHIPILSNLSIVPIVLLGDSIFERFKSTGWATHLRSRSDVFNAGVGGDTIPNVMYRLCLPSNSENIPSLWSALQDKDVKTWVLMIGTNNFRPSSKDKESVGLKEDEIEAYWMLVSAVLECAPGSRVICCEMFPRTDIKIEAVENSNRNLKERIGNDEGMKEKVTWLDSNWKEVLGEKLENLDDNVHLDKKAYEIWGRMIEEAIR